jgi:NTE family protein
MGAAFSWGRFTSLVALEGGTTLHGTLPLGDAFTLGGPRHLAGFAQDQLIGGDYLYGRIDGQYRLNFASPLYGLTLIAGISVEGGRMTKPLVESSVSGWQRSLSAYLGANTFLGPVYVGVADSKNGKGRFYLIIGTP